MADMAVGTTSRPSAAVPTEKTWVQPGCKAPPVQPCFGCTPRGRPKDPTPLRRSAVARRLDCCSAPWRRRSWMDAARLADRSKKNHRHSLPRAPRRRFDHFSTFTARLPYGGSPATTAAPPPSSPKHLTSPEPFTSPHTNPPPTATGEKLMLSGTVMDDHLQHCIFSSTIPQAYSAPPDTAESALLQYKSFDGASLSFRSHHRIHQP